MSADRHIEEPVWAWAEVPGVHGPMEMHDPEAGMTAMAKRPGAIRCDGCGGTGLALTGVEHAGVREVGGCQDCAGTGAGNYMELSDEADDHD